MPSCSDPFSVDDKVYESYLLSGLTMEEFEEREMRRLEEEEAEEYDQHRAHFLKDSNDRFKKKSSFVSLFRFIPLLLIPFQSHSALSRLSGDLRAFKALTVRGDPGLHERSRTSQVLLISNWSRAGGQVPLERLTIAWVA